MGDHQVRTPDRNGNDKDDDDDDDDKKDEDKVRKQKDSEDEYKKLNLTPGQIPVMIGDRVYIVQPAIVEYGLTATGGSVLSPPRFTSAGGGGPPPPALQVLPLDLKVQKETGDKGDRGPREDKGDPGTQG